MVISWLNACTYVNDAFYISLFSRILNFGQFSEYKIEEPILEEIHWIQIFRDILYWIKSFFDTTLVIVRKRTKTRKWNQLKIPETFCCENL